MSNMIFDDSYTRIGIKLSGGADSAMVYYMVCDHYRDRPDIKLYAITLSTSGKPYYADFAKQVIEVVGTLTGRYPEQHFTKFIDHNDWGNSGPYDRGQEDLVDEVVEKVRPDIIYSGLTQNPDPDHMRNYLLQNLLRFSLDEKEVLQHLGARDKSRDPENFNLTAAYARNKPFITGDKRAVAEEYNRYELMDTLYPFTFSCEGLSRYDGVAHTKHCGCCFFCLERYYAFGRII